MRVGESDLVIKRRETVVTLTPVLCEPSSSDYDVVLGLVVQHSLEPFGCGVVRRTAIVLTAALLLFDGTCALSSRDRPLLQARGLRLRHLRSSSSCSCWHNTQVYVLSRLTNRLKQNSRKKKTVFMLKSTRLWVLCSKLRRTKLVHPENRCTHIHVQDVPLTGIISSWRALTREMQCQQVRAVDKCVANNL